MVPNGSKWFHLQMVPKWSDRQMVANGSEWIHLQMVPNGLAVKWSLNGSRFGLQENHSQILWEWFFSANGK